MSTKQTKKSTKPNAFPDYATLFTQLLTNIRQQCGDKGKHKYDVWFADIQLENFNPTTKTLTLQVPSRYVYEYLEDDGFPILTTALRQTFGSSITLQYRIRPTETFSDRAAHLTSRAAPSHHGPIHIQIPNARQRLEDGLRYYLKDKPLEWLPGYEHIVRWLSDNDNRGLLCFGYPGVGKSLICQKIIPVLIGDQQPIVSVKATELHDRLDELKQARILIIDDLGKEPRKHYGDIDQSFFELCDNAERTGALLIITTNLIAYDTDDSHYPDTIQHRYGDEVLSRLKAITHTARIEGKDLR